VTVDTMRPVVEGIFEKLGLPTPDAKQAAEVLLYADLHGIDSHGVSNMMQHYERWVGTGDINPTPQPKVLREAPATLTLDADRGLGLVIGPYAMRRAMEKAETCGIGAVAVKNVNHFGACAYHAQLALERDMIGVVMTTSGLCTAPTFGAEARLGTNPIGFAAPTRNEVPFLFDASMSSLPINKVDLAKRLGRQLAGGCIATADGEPILDDTAVPEKYLILPLGSTRELGSHKGYGLGVMIDILSGILSGGAPSLQPAPPVSHHFLAYRVDAFTDLDEFKDDLDRFLKALRETPPAPGHERVYYAGLPEHEDAIERGQHGVPYHPDVIEWFRDAATRHGVPHPFGAESEAT
jgi:L-2-hydroxycarboxylate dehydrogenase (NAD+)